MKIGENNVKDINPAITQYCFAERLKVLSINLINNILKYYDLIQKKKENPLPEEILKWFMNDLIRETELAIHVTNGMYFKLALNLINESFSKFSEDPEDAVQQLRDALTKITTQATNAYSKL